MHTICGISKVISFFLFLDYGNLKNVRDRLFFFFFFFKKRKKISARKLDEFSKV